MMIPHDYYSLVLFYGYYLMITGDGIGATRPQAATVYSFWCFQTKRPRFTNLRAIRTIASVFRICVSNFI